MAESARWTAEAATAWSRRVGWLVGCNYAPSTAVNQLEMWQPETFDLVTIDRELGFAESLGFNSLRVFLHDLLWEADSDGLCRRIDQFLETAASHGIGVLFVLFDGVWDPHPKLGPQPQPRPGVHNSRWVQGPGAEVLADAAKRAALEPYVKGILGRYRDDPRVHGWDLFNEPDNRNPAYSDSELANKAECALALLREAFAWAWAVRPSQPLTTGVWRGDWSDDKLNDIARFSLESSDVISFHEYGPIDAMNRRLVELRRFGRPMLCTEYLARQNGSRFDPVLGQLMDKSVGAYNWGFVSGKTQTIYPWDSWTNAYNAEPEPWFHDILRPDGRPFDLTEARYIRSVTGR